MAKLIVEGKCSLQGKVKVSTAKNAILPIMAASLLCDGESVLEDICELEDVKTMREVLTSVGANLKADGSTIRIDASDIKNCEPPYELIRRMRASFLTMGPLLARTGQAKISLPGGCAIGTRPIDLHLKGFSAMGANISLGHGYIEAYADKLIGKSIYLDFPSVGATENIMMAACLAQGTTTIENSAEEPEIVDLANFLNKIGAKVRGAGTDTIRIEGVSALKGTVYTPIPDRIEAGSFMVAAAATGGDVLIDCVIPEHIKPVSAKLKEMGVEVFELERSIRVKACGAFNSVDIKTLPYPGFPTDMQAQMVAAMCVAEGTSMITETVFENRFMHVDELKRMGARIKVHGRSSIVEGCRSGFTGSKVKATDLRAGAALIIAGLCADGITEISDVFHIDRGYDNIENKFTQLGANIKRQNE